MDSMHGTARNARFMTPNSALNTFKLFWILVVLWAELGVFDFTLRSCRWPEPSLTPDRLGHSGSAPDGQTKRLLLVADPQVLDHRSYPERGRFGGWASQAMVDMNLRRSWRATLRRTRPDAVVFLGDMMDGGRYAMSHGEYEEYFQRFASIFRSDPLLPVYFIPGNHDVGLGQSEHFAPDIRARYATHFGPLNQLWTIAGHDFVMFDTLDLIEEEVRRGQSGEGYASWKPQGRAFRLIERYQNASDGRPVVLFTHVPLYRSLNTECGPLRERGTIKQGFGFGYQNTLTKELSDHLLQTLRPAVIFSGDDHDACDCVHVIPQAVKSEAQQVHEITVKSFSIAMGVRQPGFHLLSLHSLGTHSEVACLLPDQLSIYLSVYLPLAAASVALLLVFNALLPRRRDNFVDSDSVETFLMSAPRDADVEADADGVDDAGPSPKSLRHRIFALPGLSGAAAVGSRCVSALTGRGRVRGRGVLADFGRDMIEVACPALGTFLFLAWWTFR